VRRRNNQRGRLGELLLRIYPFNLILLPVNLAGVSLQQAITNQ
jgi:hypothetical protein